MLSTRQRWGWASALAAAIVVGAGVGAPGATAGTIEVEPCATASSVVTPSVLWQVEMTYWAPRFSIDAPETCAGGSVIEFSTRGSDELPYDAWVGASVRVPWRTATLSGVEAAWTTNPAIHPDWKIRATAYNDYGDQRLVAGCNLPASPNCRAFSASYSAMTIPADTTRLTWDVHCYTTPCASRGSPVWLWRASRMAFTVNDAIAPVVVDDSATGSALTAPSTWLRGRQAFSIRAEDRGGLGIESTRVLVDGREISSTNDVDCPRQWVGGWWCWEHATTRATVDTSRLADGEHEQTIEATDATGNTTQRRSTLRTDNHSDTPAAAAVSPSAWSTTNAFDVSWTNPAGGAPIVAAYVTRCDENGANCDTTRVARSAIETMTGQSVPGAGEWPITIALEDAAGNVGPAVQAGTARLAAAPVASTMPSVSGNAREGEELTLDAGSWSGVPAPATTTWLVCDEAGDNCAPITGANATALQLAPEHVGATVRVEITATNAGGQQTERSAPSAVVQARPPVLTAPPRTSAATGRTVAAPSGSTLRDALVVGGTLDVGGDAWDGTANLSVDVQWQRCDATGSGCAAISGAQARTYAPVRADIDHAVRAEIVARNVAGAARAITDPVLILDDAPPREETREGEQERPPTKPEPAQPEAAQAAIARPSDAPRPRALGSLLSSTAPRAECLRGLRVRLPATGRLRVDGALPGRARVLAGGRLVLQVETTSTGVSVRNASGALLGVVRSSSTVRWLRQSPTRVSARAADGSALVVVGIDGRRGRAIVKGRTCRYSAPKTARVVARADRAARWSAWLFDETGAPIGNAKLRVSDGNGSAVVTTDAHGRARLRQTAAAGSRTVTISYSGDERHSGATFAARLTIQNVTMLSGSASRTTVAIRGQVRGAARAVRVEYLDEAKRWRLLASSRAGASGHWAVRSATPGQHAGGSQLVVRAIVGATGNFAARTGGEVRIDLQKAGNR